jgi:hypothetical protein
MAEWVAAGWGTPRIARELNRLGVKSSAGKQWGATRVRNLLTCPVHCGLMWAGDGLVEGEFAAMRIYEPEVREAILKAFSSRAQVPSRTKGAGTAGGRCRCTTARPSAADLRPCRTGAGAARPWARASAAGSPSLCGRWTTG